MVCHGVGVGYDLLNLSNYLFQAVRQFDCVLLGMVWEMIQVAKKMIVGKVRYEIVQVKSKRGEGERDI